jgi:hypothetical protein
MPSFTGSSLSIVGLTLLVADDGLEPVSNASTAGSNGAMYVPALPSALIPNPPSRNGSNSTTAQHFLSLVNVTLKLTTCSAPVLQQQQVLACRQAATVGAAWTSPTVGAPSIAYRTADGVGTESFAFVAMCCGTEVHAFLEDVR